MGRILRLPLARGRHGLRSTTEQFTAVTAAAVREWQRSLGLPPTGVVLLDDVLFVPSRALWVPTRLVGEVAVGAPIAAGRPITEVLSDEPILAVEFGETAPSEFVPGLRGEVTFPTGARRRVKLVSLETTAGRMTAKVGPEPEPLCWPAACLELVPLAGSTEVLVDWVIVPETSGVMVPVAALQIVTGLEIGERVVLP